MVNSVGYQWFNVDGTETCAVTRGNNFRTTRDSKQDCVSSNKQDHCTKWLVILCLFCRVEVSGQLRSLVVPLKRCVHGRHVQRDDDCGILSSAVTLTNWKIVHLLRTSEFDQRGRTAKKALTESAKCAHWGVNLPMTLS